MQMKLRNKKFFSLLLCMMLIVAIACTTIGCGGNDDSGKGNTPSTESQGNETPKTTVLGEGNTKFLFTVVDKDGKETGFEIHTDKEIVGEALLELGLISGDEGAYGLYVKTVNGITADYDKDKTYWAFYVNDAYASSGVDLTPIKEGEVYSFRIEK